MVEADEQTLIDLKEDLAELAGLMAPPIERLRLHEKHLEQSQEIYYEPSRAYILEQTRALFERYTKLRAQCTEELRWAKQWSVADIPRLIRKKKEHGDLLRILQSSLGSVLTAGNWQSPSFASSGMPQAGSDYTRVIAYKNDYKRDRNIEGDEYSKRFTKEYIDTGLRPQPLAYITSSGMAALSTVLHTLIPDVGPDGVVLAGKTSYFQNKWQLESTFPGKILYVDELDTEEIIRLAKQHKPQVVFFDSICGAEELPMPNLPLLIRKLSSSLSSQTTFVLDNTPLATAYQPLSDLPYRIGGMRLVVIESIQKYHEFGFDRVSAGIIWTLDSPGSSLAVARMNLGTNITDASVVQLPQPNRALFDARLKRIGRNALLLATRLDAAARQVGSIVSHVAYPGLSPQVLKKDKRFYGGFFSLVFKPEYRTLSHYDRFVDKVLSEAKKRSVDIIAGTTFGFTTTRIYIPARLSGDIAQAYVRVSVGTETMREMDVLAELFTSALLL